MAKSFFEALFVLRILQKPFRRDSRLPVQAQCEVKGKYEKN
jgi:hypothetical protein